MERSIPKHVPSKHSKARYDHPCLYTMLSDNSTLALAASRSNSHDNAHECLHRGRELVGLYLLLVELELARTRARTLRRWRKFLDRCLLYASRCRLEGSQNRRSQVTAAAAVAAAGAPPPVLADAAAATAACLALAAPPAVLADAGAAALLAEVALPPMLADAGAAAFLADLAVPPVLADAGAATGLAGAAPPPVLAEVTAAALLAVAAPPPVLADAAAAALFALCAPPAMRTGRGHDDRTNRVIVRPVRPRSDRFASWPPLPQVPCRNYFCLSACLCNHCLSVCLSRLFVGCTETPILEQGFNTNP